MKQIKTVNEKSYLFRQEKLNITNKNPLRQRV